MKRRLKRYLSLVAASLLSLTVWVVTATAQEYYSQNAQAAFQAIECHTPEALWDGAGFEQAARCFQRKLGVPATGELDADQWETLFAWGGVTGELDEYGVSDGMRALVLDAFNQFEADEPYTGPIWAGARDAVLIRALYSGAFSDISDDDLPKVRNLFAGLVLQHFVYVTRFGDACRYEGDQRYEYRVDRPLFPWLEEESLRTIDQLFFLVPPAFEQAVEAAMYESVTTPGFGPQQDMARLLRREDCGSLRTALLRENMGAYLSGQPPATLADMEARYGTSRPNDLSVSAETPESWEPFVRACFRGRRSLTTQSREALAGYCTCTERHLRATDLGVVYNAFLQNWNRATETFWNTPVMDPIGRVCSDRSYPADQENTDEILRDLTLR
ncbi:MAG: hypothetical protein AAGA28_01545 [Pseudomonadota bacterium]